MKAVIGLPDGATTLGSIMFHCWFASEAVKELLSQPNLRISPASRASAQKLRDQISEDIFDEEGRFKDGDAQFSAWKVSHLKTLATTFETHFLGDCMEQNLYIIPPVQAYDTRVLIEEGERLLSHKVLPKLATFPKALEDTKLAARCLAFDLWTATGFHIARATEGLIQAYWLHVRTPRSLPAKGGRTWVALCRELKGRDATASKPAVHPAGDQSLVDFLLQIGDGYRNPLVHPEHSLDETDGNLLLEGCKAAMTKLLTVLP